MKKLMTLLAVMTSLAVFSPTTADARDRHHRSSHHHHSSRHYTSYRHHHHHYYSRPYLTSGYYGGYYNDRVIIGYDRYGYPIYGYASPRYYPRHRTYVSTPGFHLSFWR